MSGSGGERSEKLWGLEGHKQSEIPSKVMENQEKICGMLMLGTSPPIRIFFASVLPGAVTKEEGKKQIVWSLGTRLEKEHCFT